MSDTCISFDYLKQLKSIFAVVVSGGDSFANITLPISLKIKSKNKCVSGNGSENFIYGRHTYFF